MIKGEKVIGKGEDGVLSEVEAEMVRTCLMRAVDGGEGQSEGKWGEGDSMYV